MNYLESFLENLLSSVPGFLFALILFIIAIAVSNIVKKLVLKALEALKFPSLLSKWGLSDEKGLTDIMSLIAGIVSLIVFLLFLPGIFSYMNLDAISIPIQNMITQLLSFLPNLLGAILILVIGIYLAKFVKELSKLLLSKTGIDKLQSKLGIKETTDAVKFSSVLSNIIYFIILVPMIISSLQLLNISAISEPAIAMLYSIFNMIPNVTASIIVLVIGVNIAKLVANLLAGILSSLGVNEAINKLVFIHDKSLKKMNLVNIITKTIQYLIVLIFTVEAFNILKLDVLMYVGNSLLAFIPSFISAALIYIIGYIFACWVENIISSSLAASKTIAKITKLVIMVFIVFLMVNQLGIEMFIINYAFMVLLTAVGIAVAISFGIGGKKFAERTLDTLSDKIDKGEKDNSN